MDPARGSSPLRRAAKKVEMRSSVVIPLILRRQEVRAVVGLYMVSIWFNVVFAISLVAVLAVLRSRSIALTTYWSSAYRRDQDRLTQACRIALVLCQGVCPSFSTGPPLRWRIGFCW